MKKFLYSILAVSLLLQAPMQGKAAQNKDLLKAEYLFSHLAFHEAIPFYEKVANEDPALADGKLYAHLGDCYRLTKNPSQSAFWYAKAASATDAADDVKLHYAEALMMLQRYDEAATWLKKYQATVPGDRRVANLIEGCMNAKGMMSAIPEGIASLLPFNTDGSDFGPAIWDKNIAFTTDSVLGGASKKDNWTGKSYYNIYNVSCSMSGKCGSDFESISGKVNTQYHDGPCMITKDGSMMLFTRTTMVTQFLGTDPKADKGGTVHLQIMIADEYDAVEKKYKKVHPFPYNDRSYSTAHPALSPDGNTLVFASDMPGGEGGTDLYLTKKDGNGSWSKPVNLGKSVNTEGEEMFPVFVDNKTLTFASNGHPGMGGLDVYYTMWDDGGQSWNKPVSAGTPVNSSFDDMSLTMYADQKNGYFASNRPAAKKSDNIYHFFRQKIYLSLKIVDSFTGKTLEGAVVALNSLQDKRNLISDGSGAVMTNLFPQAKYDITITKQNYKAAMTTLSTTSITGAHDTLEGTVMLTPDLNISYSTVVVERFTNQPIENPTLVITKDGGSSDTLYLKTGETYATHLEPGTRYHILAIKDNYYANEKLISTMDITPESGLVNITDTIKMCKLGIGVICQIENIYYDYDKSNIREDAKPALNQLLELLRAYPKMTIQLNSHTDCRGKDAYNKNLSIARAKSVVKYLTSQGVKAKRMTAKGFGETKPVEKCPKCENCTEEQHQKNRRTEFQILKM